MKSFYFYSKDRNEKYTKIKQIYCQNILAQHEMNGAEKTATSGYKFSSLYCSM
jgi:hypothetical protein